MDILKELKNLLRFDINPINNEEFIELEKQFDPEGQFVDAEELNNLIAKLEGIPTDKFIDLKDKTGYEFDPRTKTWKK